MTAFVVTDRRGAVHLRTDDWVEAERAVMDAHYYRPGGHSQELSIRGTHPSHEFGMAVLLPGEPEFKRADHRCSKCGAYNNGSYGSHAPCGYQFDGALVTVITRELAQRGIEWTWQRGLATPPAPLEPPGA